MNQYEQLKQLGAFLDELHLAQESIKERNRQMDELERGKSSPGLSVQDFEHAEYLQNLRELPGDAPRLVKASIERGAPVAWWGRYDVLLQTSKATAAAAIAAGFPPRHHADSPQIYVFDVRLEAVGKGTLVQYMDVQAPPMNFRDGVWHLAGGYMSRSELSQTMGKMVESAVIACNAWIHALTPVFNTHAGSIGLFQEYTQRGASVQRGEIQSDLWMSHGDVIHELKRDRIDAKENSKYMRGVRDLYKDILPFKRIPGKGPQFYYLRRVMESLIPTLRTLSTLKDLQKELSPEELKSRLAEEGPRPDQPATQGGARQGVRASRPKPPNRDSSMTHNQHSKAT